MMDNLKQTPGSGADNSSGQSAKDKLLAGRFKDDEAGRGELAKAYLESERKISDLGERVKRAEELVSAYVKSAGRPAPGEDRGGTGRNDYLVDKKLADRLFDEPDKVLNEILDKRDARLLAQIGQIMTGQNQNQQIKEKFYNKYPDLKDYVSLVSIHANQVDNEKPGLPLDSAFEEVATRTRAEIAKIREEKKPGGNAEPHIGSGEGGTQKSDTGEGEENKPLTDEQKVTDFIQERKDFKTKKMGLGTGVSEALSGGEKAKE